ncbi:MAG: ribonuclease HIII [Candidatus Woesearchaeota archaeon]|jgi:ribonuclease HIII
MLRIGSDETLKGDTFGGLVVAGVFCDDSMRQKLSVSGIADSKKILDKNIPLLAKRITDLCPYVVKELYPKEYNETTQTLAMNTLHKACCDELKSIVNTSEKVLHIVDKYPGCAVGDIIETKAEDKYIEVAAASIIARKRALEQFAKLESEAGFRVPKGSTHVQEGLAQLKQSGKDPSLFVKLHFKNVQKALF